MRGSAVGRVSANPRPRARSEARCGRVTPRRTWCEGGLVPPDKTKSQLVRHDTLDRRWGRVFGFRGVFPRRLRLKREPYRRLGDQEFPLFRLERRKLLWTAAPHTRKDVTLMATVSAAVPCRAPRSSRALGQPQWSVAARKDGVRPEPCGVVQRPRGLVLAATISVMAWMSRPTRLAHTASTSARPAFPPRSVGSTASCTR